MGQAIQQRQLAVLAKADAANTVKFDVTLTRAQANAILGRYSEDDSIMQSAVNAIREALHNSGNSFESKHYIVPLEAYDGDDTSLSLLSDGEDVRILYSIVSIGDKGAFLTDNGYRSRAEAKQAWPEAV